MLKYKPEICTKSTREDLHKKSDDKENMGYLKK